MSAKVTITLGAIVTSAHILYTKHQNQLQKDFPKQMMDSKANAEAKCLALSDAK